MRSIDELLDEVELLPSDDIFVFNDILSNRVRDMKREMLINSVREAREDYNAGKAEKSTVQDIMNEILA
jgi:hypothetical protein